MLVAIHEIFQLAAIETGYTRQYNEPMWLKAIMPQATPQAVKRFVWWGDVRHNICFMYICQQKITKMGIEPIYQTPSSGWMVCKHPTLRSIQVRDLRLGNAQSLFVAGLRTILYATWQLTEEYRGFHSLASRRVFLAKRMNLRCGGVTLNDGGLAGRLLSWSFIGGESIRFL